MRCNCFKATDPPRRDSLIFNIKFPETSGTHFIDLGRMNSWVDPLSGFEHGTPRLWMQNLNHTFVVQRNVIQVKRSDLTDRPILIYKEKTLKYR